MERLNVNQETVDSLRTWLQGLYPSNAEPLPGSFLKLDDDILWLDLFPMRIVWGYDLPEFCQAYCPDFFGESPVCIEGQYINDRAPLDPEETPMPIWPEEEGGQQEQSQERDGEQQMGGRRPRKGDPKPLTLHQRQKIIADTLKRLGEEAVKRATQKLRAKHPELVP